jgi:hypothetical protein
MPATRRLILFIIIILLLLLLFIVVPSVSWSQTPPPNPWQDPARELAKKIVAVTGPRQTLALTVRNISSLSDSEVAAVRLALEAELRAAGLRLAAVVPPASSRRPSPESAAAPELRITLSENVQGLLWIAEVPRDDSRDVAMVSLPRTAAPTPSATTQMFVLESKFLYEQDEPILGFAVLDSQPSGAAPTLLVLDSVKLSILQFEKERWTVLQSELLPKSILASRDPRGVGILGNQFAFFLAGTYCVGSTQPALKMQCYGFDKDLPEPLEHYAPLLTSFVVPGRNFSKASIRASGERILREAQYYSTSVLAEGEAIRLVFANLDGTASLYSELRSPTPIATFSGWGSELQGIRSACGRGAQLLVTRNGDWTEQDVVQAIEIEGTQANAVSLPISLPGPVMELLQSNVPQSAGAVIRNLTTGRYEAYNLTLSCGR